MWFRISVDENVEEKGTLMANLWFTNWRLLNYSYLTATKLILKDYRERELKDGYKKNSKEKQIEL